MQALEQEIQSARKKIVADGYEMSIGEVMNLYRDEELVIDPDFQRYFRWEPDQKTRFIESLLLGIPIPPIFVFQTKEGLWELIDGLQRLSTVLEFAGMLRDPDDGIKLPSIMEGTKLLPSLHGKRWEKSSPEANDEIGKAQQLQIKRCRLRVEILKMESDENAKYELFQRINTGGSQLSEQEVRNCTAIMLNRNFYNWLKSCAENADFLSTLDLTDTAIKKQANMEMALRFFAFRNVPYDAGLDVHEYLDDALIRLARSGIENDANERWIFEQTFLLIRVALGEDAFRRWDGIRFTGMFLLSVYEVMATGISKNLQAILNLKEQCRLEFIRERARNLWDDPVFQRSNGAGIRGTTRLSNLLPIADGFFRP